MSSTQDSEVATTANGYYSNEELLEGIDSEILLDVASQWWTRHNSAFNLYWLTINDSQRREMLIGLLPDTVDGTSENIIKPTDIMLPELNMNAMLAVNGKILSLFMLRRLVELNISYQKDVELLMKEYNNNNLTFLKSPSFSNLNLPFVDPLDPNEAIKYCSDEMTAETIQNIKEFIKIGKLFHPEVWIALKLRRKTINSFLISIITRFERNYYDQNISVAVTKESIISPNFEELLSGEIEQKNYFQTTNNSADGTTNSIEDLC